jgi:hypothetical protein
LNRESFLLQFKKIYKKQFKKTMKRTCRHSHPEDLKRMDDGRPSPASTSRPHHLDRERRRRGRAGQSGADERAAHGAPRRTVDVDVPHKTVPKMPLESWTSGPGAKPAQEEKTKQSKALFKS